MYKKILKMYHKLIRCDEHTNILTAKLSTIINYYLFPKYHMTDEEPKILLL